MIKRGKGDQEKGGIYFQKKITPPLLCWAHSDDVDLFISDEKNYHRIQQDLFIHCQVSEVNEFISRNF